LDYIDMRYADLTQRIAGESVDTWATHYEAMHRMDAGEEIFLLSVGQESDMLSPPGVVAAGVSSIENGRHHYTAVEGDRALRQAVAQRHAEQNNKDVDPDCVTVFSGAQNALFATAQVLLQAGDEVILIEPYYTTYPATFTASGATLVPVVSTPEQSFQLDAKRVIEAITPRTRVIVINSPNNPTGAIYTKEPLQALVDICRERNIWLVSDEVYMDVVEDPALCRPFALDRAENVVISISSVSKTHRMTGWRVGWAIGPKEISRHYYNLNMCMSYGLPGFTQEAALHALRYEHEVTQQITRRLAEQRAIVIEELKSIPGTELYRSGAGMFVMMNIGALGVDAMDFAARLLDAEGVSVQPCNGFGKNCGGLIRVSAVLKEDSLRDACKRIVRYIASIT
jgi:arginine:pyruvate transaminase